MATNFVAPDGNDKLVMAFAAFIVSHSILHHFVRPPMNLYIW